MPMDMDIFTLFGLFVIATMMIYYALRFVLVCLRVLHWIVGVLFYFLIWLFAPKTWREMHDA